MNKNILTCFFIFIIAGVNAQNLSKLGFDWKKPVPFVEIPEQFKNEDAVAVYQEITLSNMHDLPAKIPFFSYYSIKQRIRIQTKEALDDITNFAVWKVGGTAPVTLDARTIKRSGEIIKTNRESIKELKAYNKMTRQYNSQYRVSIPGVEVGDDVEIIYSVRRDYLTYSSDIFLNGDYAILKSSFTLNTYTGIVTDVYNHNGMPEMANIDQPDKTVMKWSMENLLPMKDQNYHIDDRELPFIRIHVKEISFPSLSRPIEVGMRSWAEMYDNVSYNVYNKGSKTKGLEKYVETVKPQLASLNTVGKVAFFADMFNKDFDIVSHLNEKERDLTLVEQFNIKRIDNDNLILFYKHLFHYLNIPASLALAKNRYRGQLTVDEITSNQISDVMFVFKDEQGATHFLYPSDDDTRYSVDEVPFYLENTKIILLTKGDPDTKDKADVSYANVGKIPGDQNVRSISCQYTITKEGNASLETKATYSGLASTYLRRGWTDVLKNYDRKKILEWLEEEDSLTYQLDTLISDEALTIYPFTFNYRIKSQLIDAVSEAGDSIYSAKIKVTPSHFLFPYSEKKRTTTAYYPFEYTDNISVFIEFPQAVSILNESDLQKKKNNELGMFEQSLVRVSPSIYKLTSSYKYKNSVIVPDKFEQFKELNDMVKQSEEINILYKNN